MKECEIFALLVCYASQISS